MEAQALIKGYMDLAEERRLTRIAEDEESKTIHESEQNQIDREINNALQPVFDTDKEIASIEKATSELRAELERLEGKLRDCRHTRASLAAVEKKEKRRLLGEKQRALDDYNSRTEELNTIREKMDAIEKDKLVAKLLETYSGEGDTAGLKEVGGLGGEARATSPPDQHPESTKRKIETPTFDTGTIKRFKQGTPAKSYENEPAWVQKMRDQDISEVSPDGIIGESDNQASIPPNKTKSTGESIEPPIEQSPISGPVVIQRTITIEELNNDHYIVPHKESWIILKCDTCDIRFNSNPIHGAAKHLAGKRHSLTRSHNQAISLCAFIVIDATLEAVNENNRIFKELEAKGRKPRNMVSRAHKSRKSSTPYEQPYTSPYRATASGSESGEAAANSAPVQAEEREYHTTAQPGEIYLCKFDEWPLWPVIVIGWEDVPSNIRQDRPHSIGSDGVLTTDYQDGGPKANELSLAVQFFDDDQSYAWVSNYSLRNIDFNNPIIPALQNRREVVHAYKRAKEYYEKTYGPIPPSGRGNDIRSRGPVGKSEVGANSQHLAVSSSLTLSGCTTVTVGFQRPLATSTMPDHRECISLPASPTVSERAGGRSSQRGTSPNGFDIVNGGNLAGLAGSIPHVEATNGTRHPNEVAKSSSPQVVQAKNFAITAPDPALKPVEDITGQAVAAVQLPEGQATTQAAKDHPALKSLQVENLPRTNEQVSLAIASEEPRISPRLDRPSSAFIPPSRTAQSGHFSIDFINE
ncbi:hypothetical protein DL95DRAFT_471562 [Leptodontidium sp. 2 PMI_412]|nr:hypothetical protein DL95DRAFT_471562 [Leptodontidium sp. 2 PMI_412]